MGSKKVDCPICEKSECSSLFKVEGMRLVRCTSCGLTYYNPNIDLEEHYAFLNKDFFVAPAIQNVQASGTKYNFNVYMEFVKDPSVIGYPDYLEPQHLEAKELWGKKILGWFISAWQQQNFQGVPTSILEMGCATGHMLFPFKEAEWTCVGQEVSPWIVEHSSKDIDVRLGELHDLKFSKDFCCVLCWDAFEHTQFPNEVLEAIHKNTTDEMVMIWQMPNADYATMHWHLWSPRQHAFFYSRGTAAKLLEKHGFRIAGEKISPEADEMVLVIVKDETVDKSKRAETVGKAKKRR